MGYGAVRGFREYQTMSSGAALVDDDWVRILFLGMALVRQGYVSTHSQVKPGGEENHEQTAKMPFQALQPFYRGPRKYHHSL